MFTHSCFIRKNNKRLKKELENLGYDTSKIKTENNCIATSTVTSSAIEITEDLFDSCNPYITWNCVGRIDCKDNEELFLAIASLRNDTDKDQWFIMDVEAYVDISVGDWFKATDINGKYHVGIKIDPMYCHKATIEELINHFKK